MWTGVSTYFWPYSVHAHTYRTHTLSHCQRHVTVHSVSTHTHTHKRRSPSALLLQPPNRKKTETVLLLLHLQRSENKPEIRSEKLTQAVLSQNQNQDFSFRSEPRNQTCLQGQKLVCAQKRQKLDSSLKPESESVFKPESRCWTWVLFRIKCRTSLSSSSSTSQLAQLPLIVSVQHTPSLPTEGERASVCLLEREREMSARES